MGVLGEILKMFGEAMTSFLARLLLKAIVVPIYKGGDLSAVANCRPICLISVVCKQVEHVIAGYLRHVWDKNDWLYEGQRGFRPGNRS